MTKGFSIEDILSTSTPHSNYSKGWKNQKDQKKSNYQRNLSHVPYSAFDLSGFASDSYKGGCNKGGGIAMAFPSYGNQTKLYNDKPLNMHNSHNKSEGFRPPSSGGMMGGGWPHSSSTSSGIPQHKKGQVEATRKSKPRKTQTVFSSHQLNNLEAKYRRSNYISTEDRNTIAETLQMSVPQVKNWFQNKRNKERKMGNQPNRNNMHLGAAPYHSSYFNRHHDIGLGGITHRY